MMLIELPGFALDGARAVMIGFARMAMVRNDPGAPTIRTDSEFDGSALIGISSAAALRLMARAVDSVAPLSWIIAPVTRPEPSAAPFCTRMTPATADEIGTVNCL